MNKPPLPSLTMELLAKGISPPSFSDDMDFAGRFAARRRARSLVESSDTTDHMVAGLILMLSAPVP